MALITDEQPASSLTLPPEVKAPPDRSYETVDNILRCGAREYDRLPAVMSRPRHRTDVWTYSDLWERSGKVAAYLQQRGVCKGDRVVIWGANSPWWVASFFGVLRLGAVVVPLDLRCSPDFADRIVKRADPVFALLSRESRLRWRGTRPFAVIEELEVLLPNRSVEDELTAEPDDAAELMFTSGTTGEPKGVILTHRNIATNVEACYQVLPSLPQHHLLSLLPLSHMFEQTVGFLLPLRGGSSIFYSSSRLPAAIFRDIQLEGITNVVLVPQVLSMFMEAIEREVRKRGAWRRWQLLQAVAGHLPIPARRVLFRSVLQQLGGRLQFFVVGGALLEPDLERRWELLGVPILQGYGSTETSPVIASTSLEDRHPLSVGKAVPGVSLKLAPDSEILVKGPNVMKGYWHEPQKTAETFEDGWLKTGDLGELDADGRLFLRGRKKELIVLANGLNVYPVDVERVLCRRPGVRDAVVLGMPGPGGPTVHAVLLLEPSADGEAIVRAANAELAGHQRIKGFSVWSGDDFPRVHTLKVKRGEVLATIQGRADQQSAPAPPTAESPVLAPGLLPFVVEVTGAEAAAVSDESTLDDLGLDSLGRVELLMAIESRYGAYLDDRQVGPNTSIRELGELIQSRPAGAARHFASWPTSPPASAARQIVQPIALALGGAATPLSVSGVDRLARLEGPVIFVSNHASHFDTPSMLRALPDVWRRRVAVAAAEDYFFRNAALGTSVALVFNAFPFSRTGTVRATLDHCAWLMDRGWSILLFPEGTRSITGEMTDFKSGVGLLAVELETPVVPVWIHGTASVLPKGRVLPRRGLVTVRFGEALHFTHDTPPAGAAAAIESSVRRLAASDRERTVRGLSQ